MRSAMKPYVKITPFSDKDGMQLASGDISELNQQLMALFFKCKACPSQSNCKKSSRHHGLMIFFNILDILEQKI